MIRAFRVAALAFVVSATAILSGCAFLLSFFGSGGAQIVSFSIDHIVGTAQIDSASRTVSATVEPVDISTLAPNIQVSPNATFSTPTLQDHVPASVIVTAQNGTSESWTVTVTVEYGISFMFGTGRVVFTKGQIDSNNPTDNTALGNGVPAGDWEPGAGDTYITAGDPVYDAAASYSVDPPYMYVSAYGNATGSYATGNTDVEYFDSGQSLWVWASGFHVTITNYGTVGDLIIGTFEGPLESNDVTGLFQNVSAGFFKVLHVQDNALY